MAIKIKGQVVIDDNQNIISSGEATATNFKTGTTNVHNSGIEVAGINVLGGNTPIGSEALIYDNGNASFVNVTATTYYGDGSNLTGLFSGAYDDLTGKPAIPTNVSSLTNDSGYQTESQVDTKIAAIPPTDLSGYDTSTQVDSKIAAIPPTDLSGYDTSTQVDSKISTAVSGVDLSGYDTSAEVTAKINTLETSLIAGAPGALDTLNELAAALGDDSNFASTVTNSLSEKANLSGATFTGAVIQGQLTAGGTGGNYLSDGEVAAYGPSTSANLWRGWNASGGSNVLTSSISALGSAMFANDITLDRATAPSDVKISGSDENAVWVSDGKFILKYDGSATFATTNVDIASTGQLTIKKTAPFTDPSFRILDRNNSNADGVLMYGDGSASFAGTVDAAGFTVNGSPMSSAVGGLSFAYTYDSSFSGSSNGGPVHGKLVTSNTNLDNSTTVIHPSFRDGDNVELTSFYQSLSGGYLKVSSASDSSQYSLFSISSVDDYSAWFGINVTRIGGTVTTFSDETDVILSFDASGGGAGAAGSSDAATLAGMLPSTDSTADTIAQRHDNGSLSMTYAYASWVRARTDINSAFDPAAFVVMSDGWYYHLNKDDMKSALDVGFIPQRYTDTAYTLAADDKGKHIKSSGQNITVPAGVFSTGDVVTIYNYSYGSATLTQGSGVTMYHAGSNGSTGNRSMANFALATILCTGSDEFVVSGTGVS